MSLGRPVFAVAIAGAVTLALWQSRTPESRERARIQAHFDSVLAELRARDVAAMRPSALANRTRLIATLEAYRNRGLFPHNYDFPGRFVPTFVDPKTGIVCAVGHLLESTGRRDIVDRVASANNHVYVAELASDSALQGWLDLNGVTLGEAARIQVPYWGDVPVTDQGTASAKGGLALGDPVAFMLGMTSAALAGANLVNNRDHQYPLLAALGTTSGLATTVVGQLMLKRGSGTANLARVATGVGLGTAVVSAIKLMPVAKHTSNAISVSPTVTLPAGESSSRVGISGSIRF
jgi:hypothetical protein